MDRVRQTLQKRGTFVSYLTFRYLIHEDHCLNTGLFILFQNFVIYQNSNYMYYTDVETDDEGNIYFQNYDIINIFE